MYIEETGAGDGDIKITVEGEEYTAEANYDLDGDGVDETVAVMTDDGHVAYVDENHDGRADVMQTIDADGVVVEQARFDAGTGDWTAEDPQQHPGGGDPRQDPNAQQMVVDLPQGDVQVGPATEDTNNDGVADTAVVQDEAGTHLVTDFDGDGSADQIVDINPAGDVTISQHTGDGQWTVVEQGRLDGQKYTPNPATGATDDATWSFGEPEPQPEPQPEPHAGRAGGSAGGRGGAAPADSDALWS
ncbi:DUF6802 family protein [Saccharopolyspora taberi]|uniref:DUF6802 family protein n=1 Tax=Saccharopolyspora taberi TaxID=60895 RepID=UPI0031E39E41